MPRPTSKFGKKKDGKKRERGNNLFKRKKFCRFTAEGVKTIDYKDIVKGSLDSLKTACPNMIVGTNNISEWLRSSGSRSDDDYVYWLDQTSRLYYQRISAQQYRDSVSAALGGRSDSPALDCIVRHLPANRPTGLPGGRL